MCGDYPMKSIQSFIPQFTLVKSYSTSKVYRQVSLVVCDGVKLGATGVGAMGWSFSSGVINSLQDKILTQQSLNFFIFNDMHM